MEIEKEKVYRAWPSGPPTYQQATSEHLQRITHNKRWNYSLFSCFEPGSLCKSRSQLYEYPNWNWHISSGLMGCCLPCITFGKTQARTRNPELSDFSHCNTQVSDEDYYRLNTDLSVWQSFNSQCSLFAFLALLGSQWIIQTVKRGETRERFGIEGSCCGDCCVSLCCSCCAVIQEEKEVELRTRPEFTGYQMTSGMTYPWDCHCMGSIVQEIDGFHFSIQRDPLLINNHCNYPGMHELFCRSSVLSKKFCIIKPAVASRNSALKDPCG